MLAAVPMRCRSSKPGSSVCGSFCRRKPTLASVRTASWAPATVLSRLIATGRITPGNRTMLRTGRTISMSSGRLGAGRRSSVAGAVGVSSVLIRSPRPARAADQQQLQTTIREFLRGQLPGAGGQGEAPLEAAVRDLEPLDRGARQPPGQAALAAYDQLPRNAHQLDAVGRHARERDLDQDLVAVGEHVHRRLPAGVRA